MVMMYTDCCRWPVGVKEWKERTKKIHKPIHLKTLGV
jgi:hypothetical protein